MANLELIVEAGMNLTTEPVNELTSGFDSKGCQAILKKLKYLKNRLNVQMTAINSK